MAKDKRISINVFNHTMQVDAMYKIVRYPAKRRCEIPRKSKFEIAMWLPYNKGGKADKAVFISDSVIRHAARSMTVESIRGNTMNKTELQNMSFEIIGYAGNAFAKFYKAVDEAGKKNYQLAEELLYQGEKELNMAHQAQTNLLCEEANGKDLDFSVILIHAQDHLMMTIMYERIAKQMIAVLKATRGV